MQSYNRYIISLLLGTYSQISPHMILDMLQLRRTIITLRTFIRFLPTVRPPVHFQVMLIGNLIVTLLAV